MKIAAAQNLAAREYQRIVGGRTALHLDSFARVTQGSANGAVHLRDASKAVSVLHARIILQVRFTNFASLDEFPQMPGGRLLARMRPCRLDSLIESHGRSTQSIQCHGA